LTLGEPAHTQGPFGVEFKNMNIPIFINNRDRLQPMRELIIWLTNHGQKSIFILDNDSSYPPLLEYYKNLPAGVKLIRLGQNLGPRSLWITGLHKKIATSFIYTDSDVTPSIECPSNLISTLLELQTLFPTIGKIGPGLEISDLPSCYHKQKDVFALESRYWQKPVGAGMYRAAVDTTFALYRPNVDFAIGNTDIRLGYPYTFRHEPWYANDNCLDEEEQYYRSHARVDFCHWSTDHFNVDIAKAVENLPASPSVLWLSEAPIKTPIWESANRATVQKWSTKPNARKFHGFYAESDTFFILSDPLILNSLAIHSHLDAQAFFRVWPNELALMNDVITPDNQVDINQMRQEFFNLFRISYNSNNTYKWRCESIVCVMPGEKENVNFGTSTRTVPQSSLMQVIVRARIQISVASEMQTPSDWPEVTRICDPLISPDF
jgi:hypothetical protein